MNAVLLLTVILCSAFGGSSASAHDNFSNNLRPIESVAGIVQSTSLNTLELFDEQDKVVRRFVYLARSPEYKKGDHIRVYFRPGDMVVTQIKRIRPVKNP